MRARRRLLPLALVALAGGALALDADAAGDSPAAGWLPERVARLFAAQPALTPAGISPLTLGRPLREAADAVRRLDPSATPIGPGCDGRDEITAQLRVDDTPLMVMAMASAQGVIEEIVAVPQTLAGAAEDAAACRVRMQAFVRTLAPRLGTPGPEAHVRLPAAEMFRVMFGDQAGVLARWFAGGATCDLSLVFATRRGQGG